MPTYQVRGEVPRKRHIQFRDNGTLLTEEVMGLEGFSGNESILYHLTSPCRVTKVDKFEPIERDEWVPDGHQHRHFKTMAGIEPGGDAISGRQLLMWNQDVEISLCRPDAEMDYFFRNGEGDEVIFVHEGTGTLETIFGDVPYKEGDYVVVPRGTTYRFRPEGDQRYLVFESPGLIEIPRRYRNEYGQLLEHAPFYHRDIHPPTELHTHRDRGEFQVKVRIRDGYQTYLLDYHPFDIVGWDGYVYPWTFSIHDFEPITGRIHMPPPSHQTFEGRNFVICSFCPRKLDFDPQAIPIPYHHSNLNSEEMIYYVSGNFGSRRGIEVGSVTLHPSGIPHGPHPGLAEKSIGQTETHELAVMCDTFHSLRLTKLAKGLDDGEYAYSWLEERAPEVGDSDGDPAGVTSHF
ncbi:MAG TPA: homogentisate 1,2-dioxygenase [Gaiellaceae bacterium]|nr:homogentisate 1,2-dioxygenase [Gaiellaceae bacterium]